MNTIVIDSNIVEEEQKKYIGLNLSQMLIDEFIFPEVKLKVDTDKGSKVFKVKFLDGTRKFECRFFGKAEGMDFTVHFSVEYQAKHRRFSFNALREQDLYAFDHLKAFNAGLGQVLNDELRRKRWQEIVSPLGNSVIGLCYIIMNYQPNVVERSMTETRMLSPTSVQNSSKKEHVIRPKADGNKTYLFRDIVKYVEHKRQREKHNITCECWGVRGHYRHYKSGKVVFIHEYEKGRKRNEIKAKDKTYVWK